MMIFCSAAKANQSKVLSSVRINNVLLLYPSPAVPPLDFPPQRSYYALVPISGTFPTQLNCDIRPGAARESYTSTEWRRLNSTGMISTPIVGGISQETFSLTLLDYSKILVHVHVHIFSVT